MRKPQPEHAPAVLFVCTANICRSPMAEALFRLILKEKGIDAQGWRIETAGTWAPQNRPADPVVVEQFAARGVDLSAHRSRIVEAALRGGFPVIVAMEPGHKEALQVEFRPLRGRVFTLAELAGEHGSVADPTGGTPEAYARTADEIERLLRLGFDRILEKQL